MANKIKIAIIGGSGIGNSLQKIFNCNNVTSREDAKNDFGYPSSDLHHGCIDGIDVTLLSRHGLGHKISPTMVNYRANIEALRLAGCTHILASTACGSLLESIDRGQLVVPDSFLDRTRFRKDTFYDGTSTNYSGVCHVPMEPAFDPHTSEIILQAAKKLGYNVKKGATIVTIEGPRFSSKAESNALRLWGGHLINMTTCPEVMLYNLMNQPTLVIDDHYAVCLAKEAGLLYATVAMATDYDCWRDCEDNVTAADVMVVFKQNVDKLKNLLIGTVKIIGSVNWEQDILKLKDLIESSNVSVKN